MENKKEKPKVVSVYRNGTASDNIAYPTTSHGIWRFIPHQGDYIISHEAKLLDKYSIERQCQLK